MAEGKPTSSLLKDTKQKAFTRSSTSNFPRAIKAYDALSEYRYETDLYRFKFISAAKLKEAAEKKKDEIGDRDEDSQGGRKQGW